MLNKLCMWVDAEELVIILVTSMRREEKTKSSWNVGGE